MAERLLLTGKAIVVTRPEGQSSAISQRLSELGANVIKFPLIAIEPLANQRINQSKLTNYNYLIFTSRNSVDMFIKVLMDDLPLGTTLKLPETVQIGAVGKQTAEALASHGILAAVVPSELFNSEALLEHKDLQAVEGKRIAIIRGEGGRDLLRDTLGERGAEVDYFDVYRRVCPVDNLLPLVKCQEQGGIDIIMLTSVEGLNNLYSLGASQTILQHTTLLVGSRRISDAINKVSHRGRVIVADDPSDEKMINCLLSWAASD
jgi:uroporphyrinogen-III synthase